MRLRVAVWAGVIAVALLFLGVVAGVRVVAFTQPPDIDCGGLEAAACDDVANDQLENFRSTNGASGPITYFRLEPSAPGSTCGDMTIELFQFTFGPVGVVSSWSAEPLCGT